MEKNNIFRFGVLVCFVIVLMFSVLVVAQESGDSGGESTKDCSTDPTQAYCDFKNTLNSGTDDLKVDGFFDGNSNVAADIRSLIEDEGLTQAGRENLASVILDHKPTNIFGDKVTDQENNARMALIVKGLGEAYSGKDATADTKAAANAVMTQVIRAGETTGPTFDFGKMDISNADLEVVTRDSGVTTGFRGLEIIPKGSTKLFRVPFGGLPSSVHRIDLSEDSVNYKKNEGSEGKSNRLSIKDSSYVQTDAKNRIIVEGNKNLPEGATMVVGFPTVNKQGYFGTVTLGDSGGEGESSLDVRGDSNVIIEYKKETGSNRPSLILKATDNKGKPVNGVGEDQSMVVGFNEKGLLDLKSVGKDVVGSVGYKDKTGNQINMRYSGKEGGPKIDLFGTNEFDGDYGENGLMLKATETGNDIDGYELRGDLSDTKDFTMEFPEGIKTSGKIIVDGKPIEFSGKDTKIDKFTVRDGKFTNAPVTTVSSKVPTDGSKPLTQEAVQKLGPLTPVLIAAGYSQVSKPNGDKLVKDASGKQWWQRADGSFIPFRQPTAGATSGNLNAGSCAGGTCSPSGAAFGGPVFNGGWFPGKYLVARPLARVASFVWRAAGAVVRWFDRVRPVRRLLGGAFRFVGGFFGRLFGWWVPFPLVEDLSFMDYLLV